MLIRHSVASPECGG